MANLHEKNLGDKPMNSFQNGGNDAFLIYLKGLPKNFGEKLVFWVKNRSSKIGKFRP